MRYVLGLLVVLFVGAVVISWAIQADMPDYQQQRAAQLALEEAQAGAPARIIAYYIVVVGFPLLAGIAASVGIWRLMRRPYLLKPDNMGRLPIVLDDQSREKLTVSALLAYHLTENKRAGVAPVPQTFSPHYALDMDLSNHESGKTGPAAPALTSSDRPALALPNLCLLGDALPTIPLGQIALGMLPSGELLTMPFSRAYHAVGHGDTRSGKTSLINGIVVQLHHQARLGMPLRIVMGDFKRELSATWNRSHLVEEVLSDPDEIAGLLQALVDEEDGVHSRYELFERAGNQLGRVIRNVEEYEQVTGQRMTRVFIIVDEINAILEAAGKRSKMARALQVALQTGAGAGLYILGGAQYMDAGTFSRAGSKQFVTRAHFGSYDPTAIKMMFGGTAMHEGHQELLTGAPGRGIVRTVGNALPMAFQALRCDEADILGCLQLPAPTPAQTVITTPLAETPAPASNEKSESDISEEMRKIVLNLAAKGRGKVEIIDSVWGARPGAGQAYKQASALYDRIIREGHTAS